MENIKEEIRKKIQCFSKVAWSNQDIMLALDIGEHFKRDRGGIRKWQD